MAPMPLQAALATMVTPRPLQAPPMMAGFAHRASSHDGAPVSTSRTCGGTTAFVRRNSMHDMMMVMQPPQDGAMMAQSPMTAICNAGPLPMMVLQPQQADPMTAQLPLPTGPPHLSVSIWTTWLQVRPKRPLLTHFAPAVLPLSWSEVRCWTSW
ncbi:hypothetical protein ABZP36_035405 [Zizania latifolia]